MLWLTTQSLNPGSFSYAPRDGPPTPRKRLMSPMSARQLKPPTTIEAIALALGAPNWGRGITIVNFMVPALSAAGVRPWVFMTTTSAVMSTSAQTKGNWSNSMAPVRRRRRALLCPTPLEPDLSFGDNGLSI
jgi:hypothetical protein